MNRQLLPDNSGVSLNMAWTTINILVTYGEAMLRLGLPFYKALRTSEILLLLLWVAALPPLSGWTSSLVTAGTVFSGLVISLPSTKYFCGCCLLCWQPSTLST
jgi:hypothetical protein